MTDSEQKCRDLAKYMTKTSVEVQSPKDWKFRVEMIIKFEVEKIFWVFSAIDWECKVKTTIKFEIQTTEKNLRRLF